MSTTDRIATCYLKLLYQLSNQYCNISVLLSLAVSEETVFVINKTHFTQLWRIIDDTLDLKMRQIECLLIRILYCFS